MYKRIYDSEEIVVDYYNDGKPMIRVSVFEDYHWKDEHFVEIPVEDKHGRWITHGRGFNNWCECSECGTVGSPFWKRCPMCEAKMGEEVAE